MERKQPRELPRKAPLVVLEALRAWGIDDTIIISLSIASERMYRTHSLEKPSPAQFAYMHLSSPTCGCRFWWQVV